MTCIKCQWLCISISMDIQSSNTDEKSTAILFYWHSVAQSYTYDRLISRKYSLAWEKVTHSLKWNNYHFDIHVQFISNTQCGCEIDLLLLRIRNMGRYSFTIIHIICAPVFRICWFEYILNLFQPFSEKNKNWKYEIIWYFI